MTSYRAPSMSDAYDLVTLTGTTRSSPSSPEITSVGALTPRQSGAKSMLCCHVTRDAISDGIIGAAATRITCRTLNEILARHSGSAALISGIRRPGDVAMKAGAEIQGRATHRRCCSVGTQPGAGDDERISAVTRCGRVAAYRNATSPPYETPHSAVDSRPASSSTVSSWRR